MCQLVVNFLSCNITKYYQNRSTFDRVIAKNKTVNFLDTMYSMFLSDHISDGIAKKTSHTNVASVPVISVVTVFLTVTRHGKASFATD